MMTARKITRIRSEAAPEPPDGRFSNCLLVDGIAYIAGMTARESDDVYGQATRIFEKIKRLIESAGGTMADVTQVLVYLPDPADFPGMNAVYQRHFPKPYPNRATIIAKLMVAGARIEIVAYAHVGKAGAARPRAKTAAKPAAKGKATARRKR